MPRKPTFNKRKGVQKKKVLASSSTTQVEEKSTQLSLASTMSSTYGPRNVMDDCVENPIPLSMDCGPTQCAVSRATHVSSETFHNTIEIEDSVAICESISDCITNYADVNVPSTSGNLILGLPRVEPAFDIDDDINIENIVPEIIPDDIGMRDMLQDFAIDLEADRQQLMAEARLQAFEERRLVEEAIDQAREREHQVPTYLLAARADDEVQPYDLGPFTQVTNFNNFVVVALICYNPNKLAA